MCGNFDRRWTCPPAIGSLDELQKEILHNSQVAIVNKVYQLEDSFDWEGMKSGNNDFQSRVLQLKKGIRKTDPDFQFIALGAGGCTICDSCAYKEQLPC